MIKYTSIYHRNTLGCKSRIFIPSIFLYSFFISTHSFSMPIFIFSIQEWLRKENISFDSTMLRPQLLQLVRMHKKAPEYAIDNLIKYYGHEVLRLPPYHPDFNPIELIWSQLKSTVRSRNVTFK